MDDQYSYEKLGLLYLGKELDFDSGAPSDVPFLYKNKNLTTHGVIIGMTGSGKTGLGVGLIEEAIMDNVPSIVIDPKGDMGNLLLTFPESKPEDFTPWIDPAEAARKEMSVNEFAAATAQNWKEGLSTWGQGTKRIESLRSKTTMTIYTPGSSAGMPVSVLSGFMAPDKSVLSDTDTLNSLVNATATSLLALLISLAILCKVKNISCSVRSYFIFGKRVKIFLWSPLLVRSSILHLPRLGFFH